MPNYITHYCCEGCGISFDKEKYAKKEKIPHHKYRLMSVSVDDEEECKKISSVLTWVDRKEGGRSEFLKSLIIDFYNKNMKEIRKEK